RVLKTYRPCQRQKRKICQNPQKGRHTRIPECLPIFLFLTNKSQLVFYVSGMNSEQVAFYLIDSF
ncbi:hypothetical protein LEMLEM_LOCUS14187, partial [Lemmus lemmus]